MSIPAKITSFLSKVATAPEKFFDITGGRARRAPGEVTNANNVHQTPRAHDASDEINNLATEALKTNSRTNPLEIPRTTERFNPMFEAHESAPRPLVANRSTLPVELKPVKEKQAKEKTKASDEEIVARNRHQDIEPIDRKEKGRTMDLKQKGPAPEANEMTRTEHTVSQAPKSSRTSIISKFNPFTKSNAVTAPPALKINFALPPTPLQTEPKTAEQVAAEKEAAKQKADQIGQHYERFIEELKWADDPQKYKTRFEGRVQAAKEELAALNPEDKNYIADKKSLDDKIASINKDLEKVNSFKGKKPIIQLSKEGYLTLASAGKSISPKEARQTLTNMMQTIKELRDEHKITIYTSNDETRTPLGYLYNKLYETTWGKELLDKSDNKFKQTIGEETLNALAQELNTLDELNSFINTMTGNITTIQARIQERQTERLNKAIHDIPSLLDIMNELKIEVDKEMGKIDNIEKFFNENIQDLKFNQIIPYEENAKMSLDEKTACIKKYLLLGKMRQAFIKKVIGEGEGDKTLFFPKEPFNRDNLIKFLDHYVGIPSTPDRPSEYEGLDDGNLMQSVIILIAIDSKQMLFEQNSGPKSARDIYFNTIPVISSLGNVKAKYTKDAFKMITDYDATFQNIGTDLKPFKPRLEFIQESLKATGKMAIAELLDANVIDEKKANELLADLRKAVGNESRVPDFKNELTRIFNELNTLTAKLPQLAT